MGQYLGDSPAQRCGTGSRIGVVVGEPQSLPSRLKHTPLRSKIAFSRLLGREIVFKPSPSGGGAVSRAPLRLSGRERSRSGSRAPIAPAVNPPRGDASSPGEKVLCKKRLLFGRLPPPPARFPSEYRESHVGPARKRRSEAATGERQRPASPPPHKLELKPNENCNIIATAIFVRFPFLFSPFTGSRKAAPPGPGWGEESPWPRPLPTPRDTRRGWPQPR